MTAFNNWSFQQRYKKKENFKHSHFHNILRIFDVLPNFAFATSETKRDY